ncbi:DUF6455 family protein [Chelativorans xinjiangense]|uniref:DUF6455 family protein n=1 Tax=Chelativorans xinjiangense TaxID=2681485 RepID=UPI00135ABF64|nr:DUF6455 family protein [Chelativorans xinjiangense]
MGNLADRIGAKARNMSEMFERCGVAPAALVMDRLGFTLAAAARSCMLCPAEKECRLWLDLQGNRGRADPPSFCPNAGRIHRARELAL